MIGKAKQLVWGVALLAGASAPAFAADVFYEPPVVEAPPVYHSYEKPAQTGGWYLRGDIDYHFPGWRGGDYVNYWAQQQPNFNGQLDSFVTGALRPALSLGGGVGYQVNRWFRADVTADYWFKSAFRGSSGTGCMVCTDESSMSALLLMANAYAELGTYKRITPYVGAGIGGAYVKWDDLRNTPPSGITVVHGGASSWRFAWSLMAGASYCINRNWKADLGYRYTRVSGGRMFEHAFAGGASAGGPGFDRGFDVHEGRAGLRYQLGGGTDCGGHKKEAFVPYEPPYQPEPLPVVYK